MHATEKLTPGARATGLLGAAVALCLCASTFASISQAEQDQDGNLRGSFSGGISPRKLPRTELAPVAVTMGGKIATTDRSVPPKLERIVLAINSHGKLQSKGLATCSLAKLNSITSTEAKRVYGDALIGHGNVTSRVSLPPTPISWPSTASSTADRRCSLRSPPAHPCP
jgi:hypothetical protein